MASKITVSIEVYLDPETGCEHILVPQTDIDKLRATAKRTYGEAEVLATSDDKERKRQGEIKKLTADHLVDACDREEAIRGEYKDAAERRTYTLVKPSWGRWLESQDEAKEIDENGTYSVNNVKFMLAVLPDCIEGMRPNEVRELSPNIGNYLWGKLRAACEPDNSRLPFTYRQP